MDRDELILQKLSELVEDVKDLRKNVGGLQKDITDVKLQQADDRRQSETASLKLTADLQRVESKLTTDLQAMESKLTADLQRVESKLTADLHQVESKLTTDLQQVESKLTTDLQRVESELTTDLQRVESKIDGAVANIRERKVDTNERWKIGGIIVSSIIAILALIKSFFFS